ncbi:IclR family transcriptional regulator [Marinobacter sp.]|uniref:IclR family transcriptional regulator n=1 Tax=Marinobacter sp. TaxID=50741 RepID=UPI0034A495E2
MAENRVESVERALSLLNTFRSDKDAWTLAQLAEKTKFHKSTILRILGSLERFGYVARGVDGLYRPGTALFRFSTTPPVSNDLESVIRPHLKTLRDKTGETASFYIRDGNERICLLREIGSGELRHYVEEGSRLGLDNSAAAKVLKNADNNSGIQTSFGERLPGVAAIAVPIFDSQDCLLGAVTLSGSVESIGSEKNSSFKDLLKETAQKICCRF